MEKAVQNTQAVIHLVEGMVNTLHLALESAVDLLQLLPVIAAVYQNVLPASGQQFPLAALIPDAGHQPLAQASAVAVL